MVAGDDNPTSHEHERTRLLIVRHGETVWNAEGRIQGQLDIGLNDVGRSQAKQVAEALRGAGLASKVTAVVSSNLSRASETADIIHSCSCPGASRHSDPNLGEMCFGALQGKSRAEAEASISEVSRHWKDGSNMAASLPEGESAAEVMLRALKALRAAGSMGMGGYVIVVAHGQLIKLSAVALALGEETLARSCSLGDAARGERCVLAAAPLSQEMQSPALKAVWTSKVVNCCMSEVHFDALDGTFHPQAWFTDMIGEEARDDTG